MSTYIDRGRYMVWIGVWEPRAKYQMRKCVTAHTEGDQHHIATWAKEHHDILYGLLLAGATPRQIRYAAGLDY